MGDLALDLVAVRRLCSNDERNRLNVFGCASDVDDESWDDDGWGRDEDAVDGGGALARGEDAMWKESRIDELILDERMAAAI